MNSTYHHDTRFIERLFTMQLMMPISSFISLHRRYASQRLGVNNPTTATLDNNNLNNSTINNTTRTAIRVSNNTPRVCIIYLLLTTSVTIGHNHKIMNLHCHHHITTYNNYLDTIDAAAADRELNITVTHRYIQAIFAIRTAYIVSTLDYSAN